MEKSGSRGVTSYAVDYIVGGQDPLDPLEKWITPDWINHYPVNKC